VSRLLESFDQAASAAGTTPAKKKSLTDTFDEVAAPAPAPRAPAAAPEPKPEHWWQVTASEQKKLDEMKTAEQGGAGVGVMQAGLHALTGAGSSLYGLVRAGGALAGGGSLQDASDEISNAQRDYTYQPPEGSAGARLLGAAAVPLSALARGTENLGDRTLAATGSPALATLADVGTNTAATLGGGKLLSSVLKTRAAAAPAPAVPPRVEPALSPVPPAAAPLAIDPAAPAPNLTLQPQATVPVRSAGFQGADPSQAAPAPSLTLQPQAAVPARSPGFPGAEPAEPGVAPPAPAPETAPGYLDPSLQVPPQPAALPPPQLEHASEGLQLAVARAQERGTPINPDVLQRHVEADTLPVPVRMSEGQATLNPSLISQEMNSRGGKAPPVPPEFYNAQGRALAQNLDVIRQRAAPDVVADNPTDHGQVLVDQYKAMDAPVVADIDAKYQALRDANGGDFPVDAPALLANTKAALKSQLLTGDAPASQMAALEGLAEDGKMSYEQFLNLRRNLGNVARTSADGNTRTAAGIMVQELEKLPLQGGAAEMKPLADAARSAARARFQAMDADPAYKAAVNDGVQPGEASPLADDFVQKYMINGKRANVHRMRQNLANQPLAIQTMPAATMDYLRAKAKADVDTGQFNASSYNNVVDKLSPKLDILMDPASAATVQQVGNVARYTTVQPKGSFVNNSNTLVGMGIDVAKNRIGDALNTATLGATGTISGIAKGIGQVRAARAATAPGAGMTRLSDLVPPAGE
jgi:hypothetical protein